MFCFVFFAAGPGRRYPHRHRADRSRNRTSRPRTGRGSDIFHSTVNVNVNKSPAAQDGPGSRVRRMCLWPCQWECQCKQAGHRHRVVSVEQRVLFATFLPIPLAFSSKFSTFSFWTLTASGSCFSLVNVSEPNVITLLSPLPFPHHHTRVRDY